MTTTIKPEDALVQPFHDEEWQNIFEEIPEDILDFDIAG